MKTILKVTGMTCQGCVSSVETSLKKVAGVSSVKVDLKSALATIEHDATTTPSTLANRIVESGFDASILES